MLQPDRTLRPSAQQVVDQLSDLKRLFGQGHDHHVACCNIATPIGNHHHAPLLRLLPEYTLSDDPVGQIFIDLGDYLRPGRSNSCRYVLLDMNFHLIGSMNGSFFPELRISSIFEDESAIIDCCSLLHENASRIGATKDFWAIQENQQSPISPISPLDFFRDAKLSMALLSLKHLVFTVKKTKIRKSPVGIAHPFFRDRPQEASDCTMVISLLPICLPSSSYVGTFFYMISLHELGEQLRCSPSSNEVIDLTI